MNRTEPTCKTCFLPEGFPGLTTNEEGVCNFCQDSRKEQDIEPRTPAEQDKIAELIKVAERIKEQSAKNNSEYDCIIGASGGLDSTYVIYVAKEIMGLNPLAVKYDNGFCHELAQDNLATSCRRLGVDLIMVSSIASAHNYLYYSVKALRNLGVFFSCCFSCHFTIAAVVYKIARDKRISYMLGSTNPVEDRLSKTSHGFMARTLASSFIRADPRKMSRFLLNETLAQINLVRLKMQFDGLSLKWLKDLFRLHPSPPKSIERIDLGQFIPWDLCAIEKTLRDELDWKTPRKTRVPYMRFDCHVLNLINYSFKKAAGISEHGILCNYLVQDGIVAKEDLLDDFAYFDDEARYEQEANKVLGELGIEPLDT